MTAQDKINELLNEAVRIWTEITKVDLTSNAWHFRYDANQQFTNHELQQSLEDLNATREMDLSGLTTGLLLHGYLNLYLERMAFTGNQVIRELDKLLETVKPFRDLEQKLHDSVLAIFIDEYLDELRQAAEHYEYHDKEAFEEFLKQPMSVATIRRDALKSLQKLEAHQFVQTENPISGTLKHNKQIFEFWNVNSLLRAAKGQILDGVSLALIREPNLFFSYFIFVVKNQSTITVLTDREQEAHPMSNEMTRRPDRVLYERMERHWFPYQLLKIKHETDSQHVHFEARTALVPINALGSPLETISKLPVEQFMWLILVFGLLNDEYGKTHKLLPNLSYTGEMVAVRDVLVAGENALLDIRSYKPLEIELSAGIASAESTVGQWEHHPVRYNEWMEKRYEARVPQDIYTAKMLFDGSEGRKLLEGNSERSLLQRHFDEKNPIRTFRADTFGSQERIANDVAWTLRYNKTLFLQKLADEEFKEQEEKVQQWLRERAHERRAFFYDAAAKKELVLPHADSYWGSEFKSGFNRKMKNCLRHSNIKSEFWSFHDIWIGSREHCGEYEQGGYSCDIVPTVCALITINCPDAYVAAYGLPLKDMPWPLEFLYKEDPYDGNHILDRLDPQDWNLKNPWKKLRTNVRVFSCKRHFNARRKALGLPKIVGDVVPLEK
jgi:hypothetical protein